MCQRLIITILLWIPLIAFASGLVNTKSEEGSVKEVANRVEAVIKEKDLNLVIRIDHAQSAKEANLELRPTELLIFGNPKVGTPLMQCQQTIGIELPQKILVWEDSAGQVWITYNDPNELAKQHGITESCAETIAKVEKALSSIAAAATKSRESAEVINEESKIPAYHPATCLSQIPDFSNHIVKLPQVTVDKSMVFNNVELTQSVDTGLFAISYFEDHHLNHTSTQLSGGQENPPISSTGSAEGLLKVDLRRGEITGMLQITGLAEVTGAHIHQGASGENGPVIIPLAGDNTVRIIPPGTILTSEQLSAYSEGNLYFNIHTPQNPAGELRGQIIPFSSPQFISVTRLSATEITEKVTTNASGLGFLQVNLETGEVKGHITLTNSGATTVTAAHIHQGAKGENGSVVISLTADEANTRFDIPPATIMTPEQLARLVQEQLYFNVHTQDYPNGAIRGQIIPLAN